MPKAPLDDSSGLCDLLQSDNINISTLLSIVVMAKVSIGLSATFKIWILCDGSIKFRLNITSYIAVKLQSTLSSLYHMYVWLRKQLVICGNMSKNTS